MKKRRKVPINSVRSYVMLWAKEEVMHKDDANLTKYCETNLRNF